MSHQTAIYNPPLDVRGSLRIANDYFNLTAPAFRRKYPQVKVGVREYVALVVSGALHALTEHDISLGGGQ